MKRVSLWMIGIGLCITMGLLTVKQGYAEEKDHAPTCTLKTLKGTYQFATTGYNIVDSVPQPIAIVEVIDVNGDGTLNVPAVTLSVNGTILRFADVGGSYTVNEGRLYGYDHVCDGRSLGHLYRTQWQGV